MFKFSLMRKRNQLFTKVVRLQALIWAILESSQFLESTEEVQAMHNEAVDLMRKIVATREPIANSKYPEGDLKALEVEVVKFMEKYENHDVTVSNRIYKQTQ